jgi:aromatic ring-opening dioxygenase catalytic subunit (LigB family)
MLLINPKADVPVVQVSVLQSEDPAAHFAMGKALASLRDSNIAIIGSGFASWHNVRSMIMGEGNDPAFKKRNAEWNKSVTDAATEKSSEERAKKFSGWRNWPGGKEMHPLSPGPRGGEHFMPLIVCAGAGGDASAEYYTDGFQGLDMYSYYWK